MAEMCRGGGISAWAKPYLGELPVPKPLHPAHARDSLPLGRGSVGDDDRRPPGETFDLAPDELPNSKFLPILKQKRTTGISQQLKLPISSQHPWGGKAKEHPEALLCHTGHSLDLCAVTCESCSPSPTDGRTAPAALAPGPAPPPAPRRAQRLAHTARSVLHPAQPSWHQHPVHALPCLPSPACPPGVPASTGKPFPALTQTSRWEAAAASSPCDGNGPAGGRQLRGAQGHCGCYVSLAPRLLPRLPEQTRLLLGTSFTGLPAQLVWLRPRERAPPSRSPGGEQQTGEKTSWEFWCD